MKGVNYSIDSVPKNYKCWDCGITGCKLWRYSGFPPIELQCVDCALKTQIKYSSILERSMNNPNFHIREDGTFDWEYIPGHFQSCDQIGWRLPAIPDEEGIGYWGYSSAPQVGVNWWKRLPLRSAVPLAQTTKFNFTWLKEVILEIVSLTP